MAFSMRCLKRTVSALLFCVSGLALAQRPDVGSLTLESTQLLTNTNPPAAQFRMSVRWSDAVRDAIASGVPITFVYQLRLRETAGWWDSVVFEQQWTRQVQYHSLSRHYRLIEHDRETLSFASEGALKAALNRMTRDLNLTPSRIQQDWIMESRVFLDTFALPAPLRLPTLFIPGWDFDSGWQQWP